MYAILMSVVDLSEDFAAFELKSTVLSLKSIRSTPKLGSTVANDPRPKSQADVGNFLRSTPLAVEDLDLPDVSLEDVL